MYQQDFSDIVDQFLSRYCRLGSGLNISDRTLFPEFRAFWNSKAHAALHPSLLGQFRIELAGRGYRSNGWKIPRWYGLALQDNGVRSDKADERQKAREAV
jgi:hypothetical protein